MVEAARVLGLLVGSILLAACLAACSSLAPPPQSSFGFVTDDSVAQDVPLTVATRYQPAPTFSVLVVPGFTAGREAELIGLAKTECLGRSFCSVGFWSGDPDAPRRLKLSDRQVSDRIVQFAVNARTGLNKTTWNCQLVGHVLGDCGQ